MSKNPYTVGPFTNSIGQVIQPGDQVLIVTEGMGHRIYCRKGVFLGTRTNGRNTLTVARVTYEGSGWVTADGKPCRFSSSEKVTYGSYTRVKQMTYYSNRIFKLA